MPLPDFLDRLANHPDSVQFNDTMAVIDELYQFTPSAFTNGELSNDAGQNNGSCKLFAFAQTHNLSEAQTLNCFGAFYREEVLTEPEGESHQNIRNFMRSGWKGIHFDSAPLAAK